MVRFHADTPVVTRDQDLLNRAPFAVALARALLSWRGDNSLVIALYGPWGSGKSSLKNMILESIGSERRLLEFNPWQFASREPLAEAFLRELGATLGASVFPSEEDRKHCIKKLQQFRAYWSLGTSPAELLKGPVATGLLLLSAAQMLLPLFSLKATVGLAIVCLLLGVVLKLLPTIGDRIADLFIAKEEAKVKPLKLVKQELASALAVLSTPVLVVMDDIDRLAPEEVRELFQLVKANADFPKLVYLLAFQRDTIEHTLEKFWPESGRDFLAKIVQIGFNVPVANRQQLETVLLQQLESLLSEAGVLQRLDKPRWEGLFVRAIRTYFESLRDVYRFLSSLSFNLGLFRAHSDLDVNVIDLIALEVLRTFEPAAYASLPASKAILTGRDWSHRESSANESPLDAVLLGLPGADRARPRAILEDLFPAATSQEQANPEREARWRRDLRVCSPEIFDRYFELVLRPNELLAADVRSILANTGDRAQLREAFSHLRDRHLLDAAVIRLEAHQADIPVDHAQVVMTALLDIGDGLTRVSPASLDVGADYYAVQTIRALLQRLPTSSRVSLFSSAVADTEGLYLPVAIVSTLIDEAKGASEPPPIPLGTLNDLKAICVTKLKHSDLADRLRDNAYLGFLLGRWREWGSLDDVREGSARIAASPDGILRLIEAVSERSVSVAPDDVASKVNWRVHLDRLFELVDRDSVEQRLAILNPNALNERERQILQVYRQAAASEGGKGLRKVPDTLEDLPTILGMMDSEYPDSQARGLTRLFDLVARQPVESNAETVSAVDRLARKTHPEVQKGAARVIQILLERASELRKAALEAKFVPTLQELIEKGSAEVRAHAIYAMTFVSHDGAVDLLIQLIRQPPSDDEAGTTRAVVFGLRNMRDKARKRKVLERLRREIPDERDPAIRQRLITAEDEIRLE